MTRALLALAALAPCIWDRDTIDDELRGLPESFTLVTGRWFRHAPAYYRKRIETLPDHLELNPYDLAAYDDLAVAYERLEDRDMAIAVMARKAQALAARPDREHQYRYHANLGTFHAHAGRFEEALGELEKALEINPSAHFGREGIQVDLIKFVAAARKNRDLWSEHNGLSWNGYTFHEASFPVGELTHSERSARSRKIPWQEAYDAVAGMLRFGGLEGAELYRILGDLFHVRRDLHLAWWACQRALERGHPAEERIRASIRAIERHWSAAGMAGAPTAEEYRAVRANADLWLENFRKAEETALSRGEDTGQPEILNRLVREADRDTPPVPDFGRGRMDLTHPMNVQYLLVGVAAASMVVAILAWLLSRLRTRSSATGP